MKGGAGKDTMTSLCDKMHKHSALQWTAGSSQGIGTAHRLIRALKETLTICINVMGSSTGMRTEDNDGSSLLYSLIVLPSPPAIRVTILIMQCKTVLTEFSLLASADSFCLGCVFQNAAQCSIGGFTHRNSVDSLQRFITDYAISTELCFYQNETFVF